MVAAVVLSTAVLGWVTLVFLIEAERQGTYSSQARRP
jgi:hypothetical protein